MLNCSVCSAHQVVDPACYVCTLYAVADDNQTTAHLLETAAGPMWIVVERVETLNEWPEPAVAHCLDIDAVSQGPTPRDAFTALVEAIQICLDEDLAVKINVRDRRTTPLEEWQRLGQILAKARQRVRVGDSVASSPTPSSSGTAASGVQRP